MIIAVCGMAGAGKSTVSDMLVEYGFCFVRLGQVTLDIVRQRGLDVNEANERAVREELRSEHGMAAYIKLNSEKIKGDAVLDNLMSWEEYKELKKMSADSVVVAVVASPAVRYRRLSQRKLDTAKDPQLRSRPSTEQEARERDIAEIENLNKAGPIAMADYTIVNEGSIEELKAGVSRFLQSCRDKSALK